MNWRYLVAAAGVLFVVTLLFCLNVQQMKITELEREKTDMAQAVADKAVQSINATIAFVNEAGQKKQESKIITKEVVKYVREKSKTDQCYDAPINSDAVNRMRERSDQVRASAKD